MFCILTRKVIEYSTNVIILNTMFILYGNIIERVTALFFLVENLLLERFDFVGD